MTWTLIKKQFLECFRSYYIVSKTGKARSKAGIVGMYALFAGIMIFLCGVFFGLSFLLGPKLAAIVQGTIVAAAIINEVIAVVIAKYAFQWAGEIQTR